MRPFWDSYWRKASRRRSFSFTRNRRSKLFSIVRKRAAFLKGFADRLDRGFDRSVRRHQDHVGARPGDLDRLEHVHAVEQRHLEIGQDEVEGFFAEFLDRVMAIDGSRNRVTFLGEDRENRRAVRVVVFDEQDRSLGCGHALRIPDFDRQGEVSLQVPLRNSLMRRSLRQEHCASRTRTIPRSVCWAVNDRAKILVPS